MTTQQMKDIPALLMIIIVLAILAMVGFIAITAETEWRDEPKSKIGHEHR